MKVLQDKNLLTNERLLLIALIELHKQNEIITSTNIELKNLIAIENRRSITKYLRKLIDNKYIKVKYSMNSHIKSREIVLLKKSFN